MNWYTVGYNNLTISKSNLKGFYHVLITEILTRYNYLRFYECHNRFQRDCWTRYWKAIDNIDGERLTTVSDEKM